MTETNIKTTAYQWFPETGETNEVVLGKRIGLKGNFAEFYYCKNAWGHARILPGSWVVTHPQFGLICMDPEIFDVLHRLTANTATKETPQ